jgi:hypothetical protein
VCEPHSLRGRGIWVKIEEEAIFSKHFNVVHQNNLTGHAQLQVLGPKTNEKKKHTHNEEGNKVILSLSTKIKRCCSNEELQL